MRVFACAGEISGDRMLAAVLATLRRERPDLEVAGLGGPLSSQQGLSSLFPLSLLAMNGLWDVARRAVFCAGLFLECARRMREFRPDIVLLVDYPGLNLRLLRVALRQGLPVHYLAPPQWWLYRDAKRRLRRHGPFLARASLQVLHPWEAEPYRGAGLAVRCGHFLNPRPPAPKEREARPGLLLCPGSRLAVLRRGLPRWLKALEAPGQKPAPPTEGRHGNAAFPEGPPDILLPPHLLAEGRRLARGFSPEPGFLVCREEAFRARAALAFPGTVTLELALWGVPTAVAAAADPLTLAVGRRILKGPYLALPNLILGRELFPEWLGSPHRLGKDAVGSLLQRLPSHAEVLEAAGELRARLGPADGAELAAGQCLRLAAERAAS